MAFAPALALVLMCGLSKNGYGLLFCFNRKAQRERERNAVAQERNAPKTITHAEHPPRMPTTMGLKGREADKNQKSNTPTGNRQ